MNVNIRAAQYVLLLKAMRYFILWIFLWWASVLRALSFKSTKHIIYPNNTSYRLHEKFYLKYVILLIAKLILFK